MIRSHRCPRPPPRPPFPTLRHTAARIYNYPTAAAAAVHRLAGRRENLSRAKKNFGGGVNRKEDNSMNMSDEYDDRSNSLLRIHQLYYAAAAAATAATATATTTTITGH